MQNLKKKNPVFYFFNFKFSEKWYGIFSVNRNQNLRHKEQ